MVKRGRRALELAAAAGVGAALAYLLLSRAPRTASFAVDTQATAELQAKLRNVDALKTEKRILEQAQLDAKLREQKLSHDLSQALQTCQEVEAKLQLQAVTLADWLVVRGRGSGGRNSGTS